MSKRIYVVATAQGNEVEVSATKMEESEDGNKITFYDGAGMVATFRGYSSVYPKTAAKA